MHVGVRVGRVHSKFDMCDVHATVHVVNVNHGTVAWHSVALIQRVMAPCL